MAWSGLRFKNNLILAKRSIKQQLFYIIEKKRDYSGAVYNQLRTTPVPYAAYSFFG
jgi:hypothetical protein